MNVPCSGYRGLVYINDTLQTSCIFNFHDDVKFGIPCECNLIPMHPDFVGDLILTGSEYKLCEGQKIVGVIEIISRST